MPVLIARKVTTEYVPVMESLGFSDPDEVGASEYRAIYECLEEAIDSADREDDPKAYAISCLQELMETAQFHLARLTQPEVTR